MNRTAGIRWPILSFCLHPLSFYTNDLPQRVHDLDEIALRLHHRVDRLVGRRRLVDHVRVLAALDAGRGLARGPPP